MTDPWTVRQDSADINDVINPEINRKNSSEIEGFEDNFLPKNCIEPLGALPDSKQYLAALERKLTKLKRDTNIIEQLSIKREECLRNLLNNTLNLDHNHLELDAPVGSSESAVHELYRHIQPVQPVSIGETLHIVKYDQLDEEPNLQENSSPEPASR